MKYIQFKSTTIVFLGMFLLCGIVLGHTATVPQGMNWYVQIDCKNINNSMLFKYFDTLLSDNLDETKLDSSELDFFSQITHISVFGKYPDSIGIIMTFQIAPDKLAPFVLNLFEEFGSVAIKEYRTTKIYSYSETTNTFCLAFPLQSTIVYSKTESDMHDFLDVVEKRVPAMPLKNKTTFTQTPIITGWVDLTNISAESQLFSNSKTIWFSAEETNENTNVHLLVEPNQSKDTGFIWSILSGLPAMLDLIISAADTHESQEVGNNTVIKALQLEISQLTKQNNNALNQLASLEEKPNTPNNQKKIKQKKDLLLKEIQQRTRKIADSSKKIEDLNRENANTSRKNNIPLKSLEIQTQIEKIEDLGVHVRYSVKISKLIAVMNLLNE
jgi:hypothetical protein